MFLEYWIKMLSLENLVKLSEENKAVQWIGHTGKQAHLYTKCYSPYDPYCEADGTVTTSVSIDDYPKHLHGEKWVIQH